MRYFIDIRGTVQNTADIKAPSDMCEIMLRRGYTPIPFRRPRQGSRLGVVTHAANWRRVYRLAKPGDLVVYQYPLLLSHYCVRMLSQLREKRKCTVALLIHDVDSIRGLHQESNAWKESMFDHVDCLICHNERMKEWLAQRKVPGEIIPLGIFDYLVGQERGNNLGEGADDAKSSVIIAGNLSPEKSPYIGKLLRMERSMAVHLYGPNFVPEEDFTKYQYHGSFPPEELTGLLQEGFGLVWDGDAIETCAGMTGQYLRYNNPHKASLYIASGLPVIIWRQAALADYIERNGLGLTIDSLEELDGRISALSQSDYRRMRENVQRESQKLRSGYYLNRVLDQIEGKRQEDRKK